MALYIDPDLIDDETAVAEAILAGLADRIDSALGLDEDDGWQPQEGSPETHWSEAVGIILATAMSLVKEKERTDYQGFGSLILGLERGTAEPAVGYTLWTFNEPPASGASYTIPDGSEVIMTAEDGTPIGYATVGDVVSTGAVEADVQVVALEPGVAANGLIGAASEFEPLPFVQDVTMTSAPTGGSEEQTVEEYLDELARRARRMKIVPVITDDYADACIDHPSVERAVAIRLLNAETYPTTPNSPGHVTVFMVDAAGQPVAAGVKTEVLASMATTDRPLAVTVHTQDPTYTALTITASIRLELGADNPATVAAVQAALVAAFEPTNFGRDDTAPGRWRTPTTTGERTITTFDVVSVIDDVDGVAAVTAATVNGGSSVTMGGWVPLPDLTGTPAITVVT